MYNRWMPSQCYSGELYHHGIRGMKWGIRRFQPYQPGQRVSGGKEVGSATKVEQRSDTRGGRKYVRRMKKDLTLLSEHNFNERRHALKDRRQIGDLDRKSYKKELKAAKKDFKQELKNIKRMKQTKSTEETRKEFAKVRAQAISEIPHYRLKSGVKTANKILDALAVGTIALSAAPVAAGAAMIGATSGAAAGLAVGALGTGAVGAAAGVKVVDSKLRKGIARRLT